VGGHRFQGWEIRFARRVLYAAFSVFLWFFGFFGIFFLTVAGFWVIAAPPHGYHRTIIHSESRH
jgi:hypothetical protein